ncbi:MAG: hypothetical protein O6945_05065 [Gammaproteobacteria bacterium]|nr:hypothetical protein [Gammaproteobacteria bacterium]
MITDEQIVYDALRIYAEQRKAFATKIVQKDFLKPDGEKATKQDIREASATALQCIRLRDHALKMADGPAKEPRIVRIN